MKQRFSWIDFSGFTAFLTVIEAYIEYVSFFKSSKFSEKLKLLY